MKIPKLIKRLCPSCKKHTEHKVLQSKNKTPGSARPLGKYAKKRSGFGKGVGNLGKYGSKPPVSKWKLAGKKTTKKTDLRYECKGCSKMHTQNKGKRTKKLELK